MKDFYRDYLVTVNLRTIKDKKIRKHFTKGPKYGEQRKIDFDQARENVINGILLKSSRKHMHDQSIVALFGKANGNVAFICEHFYT